MKISGLSAQMKSQLEQGLELPIMEQFYTIQGEGTHTGKAAYFIRIGGCDVGCHWCDVKESWDGEIHPLIKVNEVMKNVVLQPAKTVVITGGEPLMYNLQHLTSELKKEKISVHLETSGAHPFSGTFDWICLSPKKNAPPASEYYKMADELKIIIHNRHDFEWATQHASKVDSKCSLLLQPEWSQRNKVMPLIVAYVMQHPKWNISLQTHKYMNIP